MREQKFENYFGRKIAVDASMHIYSFLVRAYFQLFGRPFPPQPPISFDHEHSSLFSATLCRWW